MTPATFEFIFYMNLYQHLGLSLWCIYLFYFVLYQNFLFTIPFKFYTFSLLIFHYSSSFSVSTF